MDWSLSSDKHILLVNVQTFLLVPMKTSFNCSSHRQPTDQNSIHIRRIMNLLKILTVACTAQALAINARSDNPDPELPEARLTPRGRGWIKGCCDEFHFAPHHGSGSCSHWLEGCDRDKYRPWLD